MTSMTSMINLYNALDNFTPSAKKGSARYLRHKLIQAYPSQQAVKVPKAQRNRIIKAYINHLFETGKINKNSPNANETIKNIIRKLL